MKEVLTVNLFFKHAFSNKVYFEQNTKKIFLPNIPKIE